MSSKVSNSGKQKNDEKVHVAIRCRPMNDSEKRNRIKTVIETNMRDKEVQVACNNNQGKTYKFDKVFGPSSKQVDVYKSVVAPHIDEVLAGYNCTVLAYGQTGTGKTFTMEGERSRDEYNWENDPKAGIIPRTLSNLFDRLEKEGSEFSIHVSLLEIYNEVIYDLLSHTDEPARRRIFDDSMRKGSVIIADQTEVHVLDKSEVYKILEQGAAKRRTDATLMNEFSSRSHSVFTITVHSKELTKNGYEEEELVKIGKLNLVDLAGSENVGRSGAVEMRAREAGNINQSLLTLGRCITALVDHAPHVPYRESRLTRILQDSLGGSTKTSIIATISPGLDNLDETLSTLDYASRAKNIHNRPTVNKRMTKRTLIKQYDNEIENLRRELMATREKNGVYMDKKQYDETKARLEELELTLKQRQTELEEYKSMFFDIKEALRLKSEEYTILQDDFHKTSLELAEQSYLHEVKSEHGKRVVQQAHDVVQITSHVSQDIEKVHDKVERMKTAEVRNIETATETCGSVEKEVRAMNERTQEIVTKSKACAEVSLRDMDEFSRKTQTEKTVLSEMMDEWKQALTENMSDCVNSISSLQELTKSKLDAQDEILTNTKEELGVSLNNLKETCTAHQEAIAAKLETLLNSFADLESLIKSRLLSQHKLIASHGHHMSQDLNKLAETTKEMEKDQQENFSADMDEMLELFKQRISSIKKSQSERIRTQSHNICRNMEALSESVGTMVRDSTGIKDELQETSSLMVKQMTATAKEWHTDSQSLLKYAVENGKENQTIVGDCLRFVHSTSESVAEGVKKQQKNIKGISGEAAESTETFSNATAEIIQQSNEVFSHAVQKNKRSHEETLNLQREISAVVQSSCDEVSRKLSRLHEEDLIRVQPTGETPARKEYKYQKSFQHLPGDQELLKTFHQRMAEEEEERKIQEELERAKLEEEEKLSSTNDSGVENASRSSDSIEEEEESSGGGMPFFMAGKVKQDLKQNSRLKGSRLPLRSTQNLQ